MMISSKEAPTVLTELCGLGKTFVRVSGRTNTPIRLSQSIPALSAIMQAVLTDRSAEGHALMKHSSSAALHGKLDILNPARLVTTQAHPTKAISGICLGAPILTAQAQIQYSPFSCSTLPPMSIAEYTEHLLSAQDVVSSECYLITMILLERVKLLHPEFFMHQANAHRLLLSAFVVAVKSHEDICLSSTDFTFISGVPVAEIHNLEKAFLDALQWKTYISLEDFYGFEVRVMQEAVDCSDGYNVLNVLQKENIYGLDAAVRETEAWAQAGVISESVNPEGVGFWLCKLWGRSAERRRQLRHCRLPNRSTAATMAVDVQESGSSHLPLVSHYCCEYLQQQRIVESYETDTYALLQQPPIDVLAKEQTFAPNVKQALKNISPEHFFACTGEIDSCVLQKQSSSLRKIKTPSPGCPFDFDKESLSNVAVSTCDPFSQSQKCGLWRFNMTRSDLERMAWDCGLEEFI